MPNILRLTLFKIPDAGHVQEAVDRFSTLTQNAVKDEKPYIISSSGYSAYDDPRNQGYTFVARLVFRSKEDMDFYDGECKAHAELKSMFKGKVAGPPIVVYSDSKPQDDGLNVDKL